MAQKLEAREARDVEEAQDRTSEPSRSDAREPKADGRPEPKDKPEAKDSKADAKEPKVEAKDGKPEGKEPKAEAKDGKPEGKEPKAEAKDGKPEGKEPKAEAKDGKPEGNKEPKAEAKDGKAEKDGKADKAGRGAASEHGATAPLEAALSDEPIPSVPLPSGGPWRSYKEILAALAQRVLDAQRPIRVLQALRWEADVEEQFFRSKQRELPKVTYDKVELGFDPEQKLRELETILRDAERELGKEDKLGHILRVTAEEYREVVKLLTSRGTRDFYAWSRKLYGSPKEKLPDGRTTVRDMGFVLYDLLTAIGGERLGPEQPRDITAEMAALELNTRFERFFGDAAIRVQVDDTLLADAAAGSDYVKIRSGAAFTRSDIDILEAHEGWVHVATSLNGQAQPVARWLAKGPPRTTAVQEGLAALVEMFTFRSTPRRAKKLNDRILAVDKAEDGASFLDVFEWYRTEGYDEEACFQNARRVFRGGLLEGGAPFTKDACYCKGIALNYAFMRAAIQHDRAYLIPYLFVGKVAHEDVPVLHAHVTDGVVRPPPYLPPLFDDMNGLAIWMCYSTFFTRLGGTAIGAYYGKMMKG